MNEARALEGKSVIVTGGGRGIGRAIAVLCAAEGAKVTVNDLGCDREGEGSDPRVADSVVSEIRDAGGEAIADPTDVASKGGAQAIVDRAMGAFGCVDALISCAGISLDRTVSKTDDVLLDRVLSVHVKASFALVRAAGQAMIDRKEGGAIVLASGASAFFGTRGHAAIGAGHAAIVALTRSAALELRKHRIRVNAIVPTARTRQTQDLPTFQGIQEESMSPAHIAPIAAFLASSLAEDVHGEIVGVAGARTYVFRTRETTGSFTDGKPRSVHQLREAWRDISRP